MPEIKDLDRLSKAQLAAALRRMIEDASQSGAGGAPSATPRPRRRGKKSTVDYLTEEETAGLFRAITAADSPRDLALFEVAYHRGLRASEVGLLQMAHLRLSQRRMYVTRLKGGVSGEFLLTDREVKALRAWLRIRGTGAGPLFPSRKRKAITRQRLDQLMKEYGAAAALPAHKRHFHCLRHSCATALLEHDVTIEEVQDHLGHADIRNTMIYAKVTNRKRRRKDERLQSEW